MRACVRACVRVCVCVLNRFKAKRLEFSVSLSVVIRVACVFSFGYIPCYVTNNDVPLPLATTVNLTAERYSDSLGNSNLTEELFWGHRLQLDRRTIFGSQATT